MNKLIPSLAKGLGATDEPVVKLSLELAQGLGLTRAIADNASPGGRANNRRVEIVVQPVKL